MPCRYRESRYDQSICPNRISVRHSIPGAAKRTQRCVMKHLLILDGASASSRKHGDRLIDIAASVLCLSDYQITEIKRTWFARSTDTKLKSFFSNLKPKSKVIALCKSQGAWRTIDHLMQNKYPDIKIRLISIDPHHWIKKRKLSTGLKSAYNLYQLDKWPKGQSVEGAVNVLIDNKTTDYWNETRNCAEKEVDHNNIIHNFRIRLWLRLAEKFFNRNTLLYNGGDMCRCEIIKIEERGK